MTTKHIAIISLALVAFVVGCVAEALVVPPVQAGPEAPPVRAGTTRWEYTCTDDTEVAALNKLGAVGWELVAMNAHGQGLASSERLCFKRPLP
jgi:hypothetical protein